MSKKEFERKLRTARRLIERGVRREIKRSDEGAFQQVLSDYRSDEHLKQELMRLCSFATEEILYKQLDHFITIASHTPWQV